MHIIKLTELYTSVNFEFHNRCFHAFVLWLLLPHYDKGFGRQGHAVS